MKRVAYIRCSTKDQLTDSQINVVKKYLADNSIDAEVYEEYGSGGSTKNRPLYRKLISEIEAGMVSHVYVYRMDRFSRNVKDFLIAHELMESKGCMFISIMDNLDFSKPAGRMLAQMLSILAEFSRRILVENTKDGLAAARARGKVLGPKKKPLDISRVLAQMNQGRAVEDIAREHGLSRSQLYRRLGAA